MNEMIEKRVCLSANAESAVKMSAFKRNYLNCLKTLGSLDKTYVLCLSVQHPVS